jgi:hypothetical protein
VKFRRWLLGQMHRQDGVGALARKVEDGDFIPAQSGRKLDEHKAWAKAITWHGESVHVLAFNRAWSEYQVAKETKAAMGT